MAMGSQNSRLGRGLASLIGDGPQKAGTAFPADGQQKTVPIDQIKPSSLNPRRDFPEKELEELASSIREKGLVQPLIVRPGKAGQDAYQIVAGERRWRAAQRARLHEVPVTVKDLTDMEALEIALVENIHREDLSPLEEA
ncbi:MAG: ParB/RepB/Spo0J family partition protein, partial [Methyloligellaceae bacterium]